MITLISRYQDDSLYERMVHSAKSTASDPKGLRFLAEKTDGLPKCAETYNRLASQAKSDILCFIHDDVEFISRGWDIAVRDIFVEHRPDILGVVGSEKYEGGRVFDAGNRYVHGMVGCDVKGSHHVRIYSKRQVFKPVKVIDGLIMFVNLDFFKYCPFDSERFDELFFHDIDLCLRAGKVGITTQVLVKHSKPEHMFGVYPENMKPISHYRKLLNEKHGLSGNVSIGDQRCCLIRYEEYLRIGPNSAYRAFEERYLCASAR